MFQSISVLASVTFFGWLFSDTAVGMCRSFVSHIRPEQNVPKVRRRRSVRKRIRIEPITSPTRLLAAPVSSTKPRRKKGSAHV